MKIYELWKAFSIWQCADRGFSAFQMLKIKLSRIHLVHLLRLKSALTIRSVMMPQKKSYKCVYALKIKISHIKCRMKCCKKNLFSYLLLLLQCLLKLFSIAIVFYWMKISVLETFWLYSKWFHQNVCYVYMCVLLVLCCQEEQECKKKMMNANFMIHDT